MSSEIWGCASQYSEAKIAAAERANARPPLDTPALSEAAIVHFQHTSCGAPTRPLARDLRAASGRADQRALFPVRREAVRDAPCRLLRPAQRHLGLPETPLFLVPPNTPTPAQATKAIRLEGVVRQVSGTTSRRPSGSSCWRRSAKCASGAMAASSRCARCSRSGKRRSRSTSSGSVQGNEQGTPTSRAICHAS